MHQCSDIAPRRSSLRWAANIRPVLGGLLVLITALPTLPVQAQQPLLAYRSIAPLIDDEGRPLATDPRAVPLDPAAQTRLGLYATEDQARQLEEVLGSRMLTVAVDCCGKDGIDSTELRARTSDAVRRSPGNPPVVVRGADLRQAARVANRLSDAGLHRVWLVVTPEGEGVRAAR